MIDLAALIGSIHSSSDGLDARLIKKPPTSPHTLHNDWLYTRAEPFFAIVTVCYNGDSSSLSPCNFTIS